MERFLISSDRSKLDIVIIHGFLCQSYWAKNIPLEVVRKSIEHSLCFGVYEENKQIGFARVITDYTSLAYLADVFILEAYQGQGLGKRLIQYILDYPELQSVRKWLLVTGDAHTFYQQYEFRSLTAPENYLERIKSRE